MLQLRLSIFLANLPYANFVHLPNRPGIPARGCLWGEEERYDKMEKRRPMLTLFFRYYPTSQTNAVPMEESRIGKALITPQVFSGNNNNICHCHYLFIGCLTLWPSAHLAFHSSIHTLTYAGTLHCYPGYLWVNKKINP